MVRSIRISGYYLTKSMNLLDYQLIYTTISKDIVSDDPEL